MHQKYLPAIIAGIISAVLFLLVASLGLGFFFMFLPTLPLLYIGLGGNTKGTMIASLTGSILIAIAGGAEIAAIFFLFLGIASWYMASKSLMSRGTSEWFPMGITMLHLTLYGISVIAAMTLFYMDTDGGIAAIISDHVNREFANLENQYGEKLDATVKSLAFLIFSMTLWLWVLAIYAHACFANWLLARNKKAIRPSLAIEIFTMPNWILSLLLIAALASLIGSESMQFLGKSTIIALLFPYFLLGCAIMHSASKSWPSRRFFLFFVYFMIAAQLWPALVLSAVGFFNHIKRLSGRETSTRS